MSDRVLQDVAPPLDGPALRVLLGSAAVAAFLMLAPFFVCEQLGLPRHPESGPKPPPVDPLAGFVTIKDETDFWRMLETERAIVFVDVDWSLSLPPSRLAAARLAETLSRAGIRDITYYRLDLTEQQGALFEAAGRWVGPQGAGRVLSSGYGELLWVREGRIQGYVIHAADHEKHLVNHTLRLLPSR